MSSAKALRHDPPDHGPSFAAPLGETPVATPAFRRSMLLLVGLSIPLWAVIIGAGYLIARAIG